MARLYPIAYLFFLPMFICACNSAGTEELSIDFSRDSSAIVFRHIDQAGLLQLKHAGLRDSTLNDLISVLQTPSERDPNILEMPVAGRIHITDTSIVFRPETAFVSGRDYLVVTHLNARFADAGRMARSELAARVKPVQKLLSR